MIRNIKWSIKYNLYILLVVVAVTCFVSGLMPIGISIFLHEKIENFSLINTIFAPLAIATGIEILVCGCTIGSQMRFMMQLGSNRDNAIISSILGVSAQIIILIIGFYLMSLVSPVIKQLAPINYIAMGLVTIYFVGTFCSSVVSCLRPRFSIPVLIAYFLIVLKLASNITVKHMEFIWPILFAYLSFNIIVGYILYKSKFSIIKSAQI